jgi:hypothetical protein
MYDKNGQKYSKNEKLLFLLNNKFKLKRIVKSAKTPIFIINLTNFFLRDHENVLFNQINFKFSINFKNISQKAELIILLKLSLN